jgi:cation transporter-like permease
MPDQRDAVLVEAARTQRMRLGSALLYGRIDERRTVNDNVRRIVASVIVAALACATCVGVSFVSDLLAQQAAAKASTSQPAAPTNGFAP